MSLICDELSGLFQEIHSKLVSVIRNMQPKNTLYACGFWLFYCDYTVLGVPCFAYNSGPSDESLKWSPADWEVETDESVEVALESIYEAITQKMEGATDEEWEALLDYQWNFYSDLCKEWNESLDSDTSPFSGWNKTDDFVIGVFEEREGEEVYDKLAVQSLGEERAKQLGVIE
jgi:hypothetical protein